jgi:hypothetical protein
MKKFANKKWFFVFIAMFFFIARFIYAYLCGWDKIPDGTDGISYNSYALAILNFSDWLTDPSFDGNYRAPVYPMFLSCIYYFFGEENFYAVYFIQIFLNVFMIYYIYKISIIIFDYKSALIAMIFSGVYIYYYYYSSTILRETLIQFFLIFLFYHIYIFIFKNINMKVMSKEFFIIIGAVSLLIHIDAKYLFYIPFILVLFFLKNNTLYAIRFSLQFLVILAVIMGPWMIRNYVAYDRIVLINTRTLDKYLDKMINKNNSENKHVSSNTNKPEQNPKKYAPSEEERVLIKAGLNPYSRSAEEIELVKNDVYPPSSFFSKAFSRAQEMWWPFRFSYDYNSFPPRIREPYSLKHNLISGIFYLPLLIFFFYGVLSIILSRKWHGFFLMYPIVIHATLHFFALAGRERHRIQIDSFIIIISIYGFLYMIEQMRIKKIAIA